MAASLDTLDQLQIDRSPTSDPLAKDARWQVVQRIAHSSAFERAPRISQLLLYLGRQTLLGRHDRLTEAAIATEVFGKTGVFDPSVDTIVRSHMVRLRQKLENYTTHESAGDPWKVLAQRGSYLLSFVPVEAPADTPVATDATPHSYNRILLFTCIVFALLSLGLAIALGYLLHVRPKPSAPPRHPLWSLLFPSNEDTTLIAADSALVAFHSLTNSTTDLQDYVHHNLATSSSSLNRLYSDIGNRRYTSFVDLSLALRLQALPESRPKAFHVEYARDITVSDLKTGNWILSGDHGANPWVYLFEPNMNFVLRRDPHTKHSYLLNRHPRPGESPTYTFSPTSGDHTVFGVLALLPNLSNTGQVLIVEGTSLAGTEAVSDFLFNDASLLPFLKSIQRPDGSLPHFEVLLQSSNLDGDSERLHIVASRVYP